MQWFKGTKLVPNKIQRMLINIKVCRTGNCRMNFHRSQTIFIIDIV